MALTVENGTGLANADAFVSVATCDSYHLARGNSAWAGTTAQKEAAIRRATAWLSSYFSWKGRQNQGRDQALAWPRWDVIDRDGWPVDTDEVPQEVKDATCEAALEEIQTPGTLTPVVTFTDRIRAERVGPLSTEYFAQPSSVEAIRPIVTRISDMLRGLTKGGGAFSGRAARG